MIQDAPLPTLDAQHLTPERVCWVLDISERTLRLWTRARKIEHEKFGGQTVRYDPRAVMDFIVKKRHRAVGPVAVASLTGGADGWPADVWARIERLIQTVVESKMRKEING